MLELLVEGLVWAALAPFGSVMMAVVEEVGCCTESCYYSDLLAAVFVWWLCLCWSIGCFCSSLKLDIAIQVGVGTVKGCCELVDALVSCLSTCWLLNLLWAIVGCCCACFFFNFATTAAYLCATWRAYCMSYRAASSQLLVTILLLVHLVLLMLCSW